MNKLEKFETLQKKKGHTPQDSTGRKMKKRGSMTVGQAALFPIICPLSIDGNVKDLATATAQPKPMN
jgi:hypothetical protein